MSLVLMTTLKNEAAKEKEFEKWKKNKNADRK